ncbi:glycosyltransferase involved in cell wall biosynthesis [Polaromonas sp. CG_9.5]|uniref:glycosyltransferase n=1 Tax=Polaromonas sp. CG_9.5 TaxID=3071705 RepID=UPI002E0B1743|nr:glycosyltransferase involved in cell wall biosynthesis [Polaromonas sp. CG_9.5]
MTQQRIAILMPDLCCGGAERVAVNLANGFVQRGHAVDMVLLSATGEFLVDLRPEVRVVDLQVKRMRGLFMPLIKYLRQTRPEAVLACMWPLTMVAIIARMLARVPARVVVAEHTTWSRSELLMRPTVRLKVRTTMKHIFPHADEIVTVSLGAADDLAQFADLDRKTITVIYNPVVSDVTPLPVAAPLLPSCWWSGSHRRILAVGMLIKVKDYSTLLRAFAVLRQRVDARLLILGEGECRDELETQARQLGIESSVFMPGFMKDLTPYYQQADLHVLSSTSEGFGNVIVEALAVGTPVVSTDCQSGPREILSNGQFGSLVQVGNAAALATAMFESLNTIHDISAIKARAQDFSIDKATDQYLELLFPNPLLKKRE